MSPESEKNLNEAIDWLQQTAGSIQDFAVEQAPLYCQEVVSWTFWLGLLGTVAGILIIGFVVLCIRWCFKNPHNDAVPGIVIASVFMSAAAAGFLCTLTPRMVKAVVAPRVVVVEHLRGL